MISSQVLRLLARWAERKSVALMATGSGGGGDAAGALSQGPGVVPLMAGIRARCQRRSTLGAAVSASGTSKYVPVWKPNMPAIRFEGKPCTMLFSDITLSL